MRHSRIKHIFSTSLMLKYWFVVDYFERGGGNSMKQVMLALLVLLMCASMAYAEEIYSTDPTDYIFWDDGDSFYLKGGTVKYPTNGRPISDSGWTLGGIDYTLLVYSNIGFNFGNLSLYGQSNNQVKNGVFVIDQSKVNDRVGVTLQASVYDENASSAKFYLGYVTADINDGNIGVDTNVIDGGSRTYYKYYSDPINKNRVTSIPRTVGWHNFTFEILHNEINYFIDGQKIFAKPNTGATLYKINLI